MNNEYKLMEPPPAEPLEACRALAAEALGRYDDDQAE